MNICCFIIFLHYAVCIYCISILSGVPSTPHIEVSDRRLDSFTITWDTFSDTVCGNVTYNVTLSDGIDVLAEHSTADTTFDFPGLDNVTDYEVTVVAINRLGPGNASSINVSTLTPSG